MGRDPEFFAAILLRTTDRLQRIPAFYCMTECLTENKMWIDILEYSYLGGWMSGESYVKKQRNFICS